MRNRIGAAGIVLALALAGAAQSAAAASYPGMAPRAQYMMERADEIALARTAAPPSISNDATVLVLGAHGYETAAKGTNGFVCLVERSWDAALGDPGFWNPKIRGPDCLNPAAVRSVLPHFIERTNWALAGLSTAEMTARTKAELAANAYPFPEAGAINFMMSKEQWLGDSGQHWHPHLMFFVGHVKGDAWGAGLAGSPVASSDGGADPVTTFYVPVRKWSDGTLADYPPSPAGASMQHSH